MKTNVGQIDRIIRIVVGLTIIALGVINHSWWGAVGLIPMMTAVTRRCPAYTPLGISTCKIDESKKS
ncbi:MAG: YgaP family membrane protein [Candidatus Zhuqueibacterota bacterium]